MNRPERTQRIETVLAFGQALLRQAEDQALLDRACAANPWFTPFFIRESIRRMQKWFDRELLELLLKGQPENQSPEANIGIIMAGNLPYVGLHDLLTCLLAGHRALVKFSSRDTVLMQDLLYKVFSITPSVKGRVRQFSPAKKLDFLLATGSDNTARFLDHHFSEVPRVIRRNRYSLAVLTGAESKNELQGLCEDIFLYNGFGCRNVASLMLPEGTGPDLLKEVLAGWPREKLSQPYLELVRRERTTSRMLGKEVIDTPHLLLLKRSGQLAAPSAPGYLHLHFYRDESDLRQQLEAVKDQLQVVVGKNREAGFGETQSPAFFDFADGLNTLQLLTQLEPATPS